MKFAIVFLMISFSAFADYKSEVKEIEKFEVQEHNNPKNYEASDKNRLPELKKEFKERLMNNPKELRYFLVTSTAYRLVTEYRNNKAFAISLENKFGGKKLTNADFEKVFAVPGDYILKENVDDLKKAIMTVQGSQAHFERMVGLVNAASFK